MSSAEDELLRPAPLVESTGGTTHAGRRVPTLVAAIPLALAAGIAALTLVAAVCLLLSAYRAALVLPIGVPAAVLAGGIVVWTAPARETWTLRPNLLALLGVAVMVWFNVRYGAQDIFVTRDPGTYAVTAQWLAHHSTGRIASQAGLFGGVPGSTPASLGFGATDSATLQSQYPNAAPMLVAMGGWVSDSWLLKVAPFIGGAALLAFYALARGIVREWWALGATTLLAVSLPMMHFSRSVFSEPTAMVFLLGGMALLFVCQELSDRLSTGRAVLLSAVAGLTGGATGLARVDGGIFLLAASGYSVMRLAQAPAGRRRKVIAEVAALLGAAVVPYALGMRLTATLSSQYWYGSSGHAAEAYIPGVLSLLILLVGTAVVAIAWHGGQVREAGVRVAARASSVFAVLLIVAAVVGATRPLWFTAHQYIGPSYTGWVAYWQGQEHQVVDGTRSYAENTLTWISWYDSLIVVAAGVLGIAWLVRRVGRTGRPPLVAFLFVFLSFGLVSLAYPDITPDQIWSVRRFVPIVIPGLLIGAAYLGQRLWRYGRRAQVAVGVLAVVALGLTVNTDRPLATVPEGVQQLAEVQTICHNLPANAAVAMTGPSASNYAMTIRAYCQVPVLTVLASDKLPLASGDLSAMQASLKSSGRALYVLSEDARLLPVGSPSIAPVSQIATRYWKPSLVHAPDTVWPKTRSMYLVAVAPDGTVTEPAGQRTLTATG